MFPAEVYDNDFFSSKGFHRKQCPSGAWFWTLDPERIYSGDQDDIEYTFIGKQVFKDRYTVGQLRELSVKWFADQGHTPMGSYPVLASLWRNDLLFTSASICNFQPHTIERQLEPVANPLIVPQKCVRLNDLENIGRSGRHLSSFTMLGHHAFNFEGEDEVYWISRTVELCHRFYSEALGADPLGITYVESVWAGGGNAGPCVEVMYEGIEIATLVFMNLQEDPEGDVDIKGVKYSPMPTRVVDTGYGLERAVWASQGTANIYEAVSPVFLKKLVEVTQFKTSGGLIDQYFRKMSSKDIETPLQYEKVQKEIADALGVTVKELAQAVRPAETLFTICDFTRTLLLMLNDHVLPSNKDAGYLVRHLAKRVMMMLHEEKFTLSPMDVIGLQFDSMVGDFPELEGKRETMIDIMHAELERHESTMARGQSQLLKEIQKLQKKKRRSFPEEKVYFFYDTLGLPIPYIREIIEENSDLTVEISDDFWEKFFNKSMALDANKSSSSFPPSSTSTERLYYEDAYAVENDARVLDVQDDWIVLDRTVFFPEGGGQPNDLGTLSIDGSTFEVSDVQVHGNTVYHKVVGAPADLKGENVRAAIDWDRRYSLMRAHSSTHLLNATLRDVLGFHVRQMGAQKGPDSTRFDIAHYRTITPGQLQEIEGRINEVIFSGSPISTEIMARGKAEDRYGFFIYQGGFVPFDQLRIVTIDDVDIEACAGTHLRNIQEASLFKILGVSQIQNNVYRFRYSVGDRALNYFQSADATLNEIMSSLGTARDATAQKVTALLQENKSQGKLLGDYEETMIRLQAQSSLQTNEQGIKTLFFKSSIPKDRAMRHIVRLARSGKKQAYFAVFQDGAVFVRSKDIKSVNLRNHKDAFASFDVLNASPDMIVFGGSPEPGALWDQGHKILNG